MITKLDIPLDYIANTWSNHQFIIKSKTQKAFVYIFLTQLLSHKLVGNLRHFTYYLHISISPISDRSWAYLLIQGKEPQVLSFSRFWWLSV